MIVGDTIFKLGGTGYSTPEFRRGGLAATFCVEVLEVYGSPTVTVTVEHRTADEVTYSTAGTFSDITAAGDAQLDVTGLKEFVRFSLGFGAGDDATDAIRIVFQAPSWRPY